MPTIEEYRSHITIAKLLIYVVIKIEMYKTEMHLVAILAKLIFTWVRELRAKVPTQSHNLYAGSAKFPVQCILEIGSLRQRVASYHHIQFQCRPNMF